MAPILIATLWSTLSSILQKPLGQIPTEYDWIKNVDMIYQELTSNLKETDDFVRGRHLLVDDKYLKQIIIHLNRFCFDVEDRINELKFLIEQKNSVLKHRKPVRDANNSKVWKARGLVDKLKEIKALLIIVKANLPTDDKGSSSYTSFDQLESMNREDDTGRTIIAKLMEQDWIGVSIIGIRGLGKRALAKYILDHTDIKKKFSLMLKVSSSEFNLEDMKPKPIDKNKDKDKDKGKGKGKEKVEDNKNFLEEDKWLLWVDDLSHVNYWRWSEFYTTYLAERNGNRKILITTVNPTVAKTTQTFPIYMQDDNYCEQLISKKISSIGTTVHDEFIKKEIGKCYGLPSIAIYMAFKLVENEKAGEQIIHKELWEVPGFKTDILPYLASSFENLNSRLLKCFCYLSLFPQDYGFNKEDLILLYIGVGLVEPDLSSLRENDCFKGLVENSFLQAKDNSQTYQMNRFTQSFVQYAAPKTYVRLCESSQTTNALNDVNTCHLSLTHGIKIQPDLWHEIKKRKCLRTFLLLCRPLRELPCDLFSILTRLRVLVLKLVKITELPNSIQSLKRLRFLDISGSWILRLPEKICTTLQILKCKNHFGRIPDLPNDFSNLTNLFYVDWEESDLRKQNPCKIGELTKLETLPLFQVGNKKGHSVTQLMNLNDLRGCIHITNLQEVKSKQDAMNAHMSKKTSLDKLKLEWTDLVDHKKKNTFQKLKQEVKKLVDCKGNSTGVEEGVEDVLDGLEPHNDLEELEIKNYGGAHLPRWLRRIHALQKVHLQNCSTCNNLFLIGQLQALEAIHLDNMSRVVSINCLFDNRPAGQTGCFPSLKSLVLCNMTNLRDWTAELRANDMTQLRELKIENCQVLTSLLSLTHLTSLVELKIEDCIALPFLPELLPSSLTSLIINKSDLLANWCRPEDQIRPTLNRNGLVLQINGDTLGMPTTGNDRRDDVVQQDYAPVANRLIRSILRKARDYLPLQTASVWLIQSTP